MSDFPARPVIRRDLSVEPLPSGLVLIGETDRRVFRGRAFGAVASALDGARSADEAACAVPPEIPAAEVWFALERLRGERLLVEAQTTAPAGDAAFWDAAGIAPETAASRLSALRVQIDTLGPDPGRLASALGAAGLRTSAEGDVRIVLTDDYLRDELAAINQRQLAAGATWLLTRPVGTTLWLGPIFRPHETACWACLAERLRLNRQVQQFVLRHRQEAPPLLKTPAALASTQQLAASSLASALALWAAGAESPIDGALTTFDTLAVTTRRHAVVRRPQCPACGDPESLRVARPISIGAVPARHRGDGGHRTVSAEATLARFAHHVSPITGVVTWLENYVGHVDDLIYSYTAGHNFVLGQDTLDWLQEGLRNRTGGKGVTEAQAKVSAIGEAIERYSGVYRGDEAFVRGTRQGLGEAAVALETCLNFSERQYAQRDAANGASSSILHRVPNRLDPSLEIEWTPLWSLTEQRPRYLPAAYCWYGHPESREHFFCAGDTNGCASGNTIEEAVLQAFLELVERDGVAIWWYNRLKRPGVDVASFQLPYLDRLAEHYRGLERSFWVLDLTADLGIPTFAALSRRTDRPVEDIVFGLGAHLDPQAALLRAVTEMNQFLPAVMRVGRNGETIYAWPEDEAIRWWRHETVARQPWLAPDPDAPLRRKQDFTDHSDDDIGAEVRTCIELCRRAGLELLVQDQTRPDIGLSVVRAVVPGLRHFWRRLGPGRLYDVPVRLGWLEAPTAEADLNPISVFI